MHACHFSKVPSNFDSEGVRVMLLDKLSKLVSPLGTRDNPAMSCQDIYNCNGDSFKPGEQYCQFTVTFCTPIPDSLTLTQMFLPPNLPPGFYWIDPNEGSPKDAIRVSCQPETCITPVKDNSKVWYLELHSVIFLPVPSKENSHPILWLGCDFILWYWFFTVPYRCMGY